MIFISFRSFQPWILLIFFYLFLFVWTPFSHMLVHMMLFFRVLELTHILSFSLYLIPSPLLPHSFSFLFFLLSVFHLNYLDIFCYLQVWFFFFFFSCQFKYTAESIVSFQVFLLYFSVGPIFQLVFFIIHSCPSMFSSNSVCYICLNTVAVFNHWAHSETVSLDFFNFQV